jgi:hypothetical protein
MLIKLWKNFQEAHLVESQYNHPVKNQLILRNNAVSKHRKIYPVGYLLWEKVHHKEDYLVAGLVNQILLKLVVRQDKIHVILILKK